MKIPDNEPGQFILAQIWDEIDAVVGHLNAERVSSDHYVDDESKRKALEAIAEIRVQHALRRTRLASGERELLDDYLARRRRRPGSR